MASKQVSLRVSSRPGGKPMKKLPASIEIDSTTTAEDAKKKLAKAMGGIDYKRIGLYDSTKEIIKDRNIILMKHKAVVDSKEIMIKDLGAQIPWKLTFVIEYSGPIIFHLAFLVIRPYIYHAKNPITNQLLGLGTVTKANDQLSQAQLVAMALIVLHYVKRELETLFLHRFSASSMPAYMIVRNSWHYWISGGLQLALFIYAPTAIAARPIDTPLAKALLYGGVALWVIGESVNFYCHIVLSRLRSVGGTERGIPHGFSFDWVTCPNYIWEILAWIGVIMITRAWNNVYFIIQGIYYMQTWSQGKESRYRKEFPGRYKAKKYPLVPGLKFSDPRKPKAPKKVE